MNEDYLAKAQAIEATRLREAQASIASSLYRLVSHDLAANTATIQRIEDPEREYTVNYLTGECQCPDYQNLIKPLNEQLARIGSDKRIECKHTDIAFTLAFLDAGYADFMEPAPVQSAGEMESDYRQGIGRQITWGRAE